jgi:hypothetical protein
MTEDIFTVVMGGHSAAAGHGNNFQQSYTLQVQRALEPIFARLGVKHTAHNMGMGGLGTIHNGLAAGDLYGKDVDILIWDSGMTEKSRKPQDLLARQGLMARDRVPIIAGVARDILKYLDEHADADVAVLGSSSAGYRMLVFQPQLMRFMLSHFHGLRATLDVTTRHFAANINTMVRAG